MDKKLEHKILEHGVDFVLEAIEEKASNEEGGKNREEVSLFYGINPNAQEHIYFQGVNEFFIDLANFDNTEWGEDLKSISDATLNCDCGNIVGIELKKMIVGELLSLFRYFADIMVVVNGKLSWKDGNDGSGDRLGEELELYYEKQKGN